MFGTELFLGFRRTHGIDEGMTDELDVHSGVPIHLFFEWKNDQHFSH